MLSPFPQVGYVKISSKGSGFKYLKTPLKFNGWNLKNGPSPLLGRPLWSSQLQKLVGFPGFPPFHHPKCWSFLVGKPPWLLGKPTIFSKPPPPPPKKKTYSHLDLTKNICETGTTWNQKNIKHVSCSSKCASECMSSQFQMHNFLDVKTQHTHK